MAQMTPIKHPSEPQDLDLGGLPFWKSVVQVGMDIIGKVNQQEDLHVHMRGSG